MLAGEVSAKELENLARETSAMKSYLSMHFDQSHCLDSTISKPLLKLLHSECNEGTITKDEAIGISVILFGAGGESTSALMGSCIFYLASLPKIQEELRSNPQLIDNFIEEVIRFSPPFKFHYRSVRSSCKIGSYDFSPGQRHCRPVPQQVRGMKGRKHRPLLVLDRFSPNFGDSLNVGKQSPGRYVSEGDDQFRRYQFQLILQDPHAGGNLHRFRVSVFRGAAFDDVGDIDILTVNAYAVNHLRQ